MVPDGNITILSNGVVSDGLVVARHTPVFIGGRSCWQPVQEGTACRSIVAACNMPVVTAAVASRCSRQAGRCRAVSTTGTVMIGGQIGWNAQGRCPDGLVTRTAQVPRGLFAVVGETGRQAGHPARLA